MCHGAYQESAEPILLAPQTGCHFTLYAVVPADSLPVDAQNSSFMSSSTRISPTTADRGLSDDTSLQDFHIVSHIGVAM